MYQDCPRAMAPRDSTDKGQPQAFCPGPRRTLAFHPLRATLLRVPPATLWPQRRLAGSPGARRMLASCWQAQASNPPRPSTQEEVGRGGGADLKTCMHAQHSLLLWCVYKARLVQNVWLVGRQGRSNACKAKPVKNCCCNQLALACTGGQGPWVSAVQSRPIDAYKYTRAMKYNTTCYSLW